MEWISVDIEFPEDLSSVDAYGYSVDLEDNHCWERVTDMFIYEGEFRDREGHCMSAFNPTHWMPLPEPPKEKDNG